VAVERPRSELRGGNIDFINTTEHRTVTVLTCHEGRDGQTWPLPCGRGRRGGHTQIDEPPDREQFPSVTLLPLAAPLLHARQTSARQAPL